MESLRPAFFLPFNGKFAIIGDNLYGDTRL